jgi:hypothetical protein
MRARRRRDEETIIGFHGEGENESSVPFPFPFLSQKRQGPKKQTNKSQLPAFDLANGRKASEQKTVVVSRKLQYNAKCTSLQSD